MRSSWSPDTTGPIWVLGSKPEPRRMSRELPTMRSRTSSWMSRCRSTRVPAVHTWPDAPQTPIVAAAAAASRSASGKTMNALLPPSSRPTRLTRLAAAAWIAAPVATDPVNEIASTSRASTSAAPAASPRAWTTLKTPGGGPARALDAVEAPGGDPRLERQLGHQHRRHRRLLGGLEHDAVAGGQGARDEAEHEGRAVPRGDEADDADRLADLGHRELRRHGGDGALELRRPS